MSKVKLDDLAIQEIADSLTQVENEDLDMQITDDALYGKFNMNFEDFSEVVSAIFQKINFGLSPLTHEAYVGIADEGCWLAKKEVNQQFIAGLISWATEGEMIPVNSRGFVRTIFNKDKPEYDITISRAKVDAAGKLVKRR